MPQRKVSEGLAPEIVDDVLQAESLIRPYVRETLLEYSLPLSQMTDCNVYLKLENLQHTGSFKTRGAFSKILSLTPEQSKRGVIAASTGNHGAAVAYCAKTLEMKGEIFVPEIALPSKIDSIKRFGVELHLHGTDCVHAEAFARKYAQKNKMTYVSPYNDRRVVGGQGTIGVELERQLDSIEAIFVALGGGGLISGIAGYLKSVSKDVRVVACSPENSCVMVQSVKADKILDLESRPTLSDGTSGGIEPGAITFDLCKRYVDDYILITEGEIRDALLLFMDSHHMMIEGAAGVALAAFLKTSHMYAKKNVVIVICGANISLDNLKEILSF